MNWDYDALLKECRDQGETGLRWQTAQEAERRAENEEGTDG